MSFDESSSRGTPESSDLSQNNCAVGKETLGARSDDDWPSSKKPRDRKKRVRTRRTVGPDDTPNEF